MAREASAASAGMEPMHDDEGMQDVDVVTVEAVPGAAEDAEDGGDDAPVQRRASDRVRPRLIAQGARRRTMYLSFSPAPMDEDAYDLASTSSGTARSSTASPRPTSRASSAPGSGTNSATAPALLYKVVRNESRLLRSALEVNGFRQTSGSDWHILWSSSHVSPYLLRNLSPWQRVNHFPRTYELTRKDRLAYNLDRMRQQYTQKHYNFFPRSYVLPQQYADLVADVSKHRFTMIFKPSASSRGRGIFLAHSVSDIPSDLQGLVSEYVDNPMLIAGHKFDLRIYVAVTSFDPLRIYVYEEGLGRISAEPYDAHVRSYGNRFVHLTNYSINKKHAAFQQNQDPDIDNFGNKWSLRAVKEHLARQGVNVPALWMQIHDLIIKSIISVEHHVNAASSMFVPHRNCFEMFGFDILIDEHLCPWLLEVNLSPSLAADSPLDHRIKANLLADTFTLVGIRAHARNRQGSQESRKLFRSLSQQAKEKQRLKQEQAAELLRRHSMQAGIGMTADRSSSSSLSMRRSSKTLNRQTRRAQASVRASGSSMSTGSSRSICVSGDSGSSRSGSSSSPAGKEAMRACMHTSAACQCAGRGVDLTAEERRMLRETDQELERARGFTRIYPATDSHAYDMFFEHRRRCNNIVIDSLMHRSFGTGVGSAAVIARTIVAATGRRTGPSGLTTTSSWVAPCAWPPFRVDNRAHTPGSSSSSSSVHNAAGGRGQASGASFRAPWTAGASSSGPAPQRGKRVTSATAENPLLLSGRAAIPDTRVDGITRRSSSTGSMIHVPRIDTNKVDRLTDDVWYDFGRRNYAMSPAAAPSHRMLAWAASWSGIEARQALATYLRRLLPILGTRGASNSTQSEAEVASVRLFLEQVGAATSKSQQHRLKQFLTRYDAETDAISRVTADVVPVDTRSGVSKTLGNLHYRDVAALLAHYCRQHNRGSSDLAVEETVPASPLTLVHRIGTRLARSELLAARSRQQQQRRQQQRQQQQTPRMHKSASAPESRQGTGMRSKRASRASFHKLPVTGQRDSTWLLVSNAGIATTSTTPR